MNNGVSLYFARVFNMNCQKYIKKPIKGKVIPVRAMTAYRILCLLDCASY